MKITNSTSFDLIAFGWSDAIGYGEDVHIAPGRSVEVHGPYVGVMGGGSCHIALDGAITCHEAQDGERGLQVERGKLLCLRAGDRGVTVRHHHDEPERFVTQWRLSNWYPRHEDRTCAVGTSLTQP